jgi:hypothetical protein
MVHQTTAWGEIRMSQLLIQTYLNELATLKRVSGTHRESVVREAFKDLLKGWARSHDLTFIPEYEIASPAEQRRYVDGALLHTLRVPFGYWETKDSQDDLDMEIGRKFRAGYPKTNIVFEDSTQAVLIQHGQEVMRCGVEDVAALERLLKLFFGYERPEIEAFRKAVEQFKADLPAVLDALRAMIEAAHAQQRFQAAAAEFLQHAREAINPGLGEADVREMLIQHILTGEVFAAVFPGTTYHEDNNVARELHKLEATFFTGNTKFQTLKGLESYYAAIRRAASEIATHHEKQAFLKAIYENLYKVYNPKAADRLGVVYTPNEVVRLAHSHARAWERGRTGHSPNSASTTAPPKQPRPKSRTPLVPTLQRGNPVLAAPAARLSALERLTRHSHARAWERGRTGRSPNSASTTAPPKQPRPKSRTPLVPTLQRGNPVLAAPAARLSALERLTRHAHARAWERGRTGHSPNSASTTAPPKQPRPKSRTPLVPTLQRGNPVLAAPAARLSALERLTRHSHARAWERGRTGHSPNSASTTAPPKQPRPKSRTPLVGLPPRCLLKTSPGDGRIVIDSETTLSGIPPEAWAYRLGNRSALDWILDQYKEKKPKDPTIRERFDTYRFADHKEKVIDLLGRVTAVSARTVDIVNAMRAARRS